MRVHRRRQRKPDPLAQPDAIRAVLQRLRSRLPDIVPASEKQLIRMLNAIRNIERRPVSDTKRGRPSRWKRKDLLRVAGQLRSLLERETKGRISLNSFTGLYIRVLDFPKDIIKPLIAGEISLFEAAQLMRLTEKRLGVTASEVHDLRGEVLRAHLLAHGSQAALQARINMLLGESTDQMPSVGRDGASVTELVDELLEVDPYDTKHLFWEELRRIAIALRDVTPEDVDDKVLDELLSVSDRLSGILVRIGRRRRQRESHQRRSMRP